MTLAKHLHLLLLRSHTTRPVLKSENCTGDSENIPVEFCSSVLNVLMYISSKRGKLQLTPVMSIRESEAFLGIFIKLLFILHVSKPHQWNSCYGENGKIFLTWLHCFTHSFVLWRLVWFQEWAVCLMYNCPVNLLLKKVRGTCRINSHL